jgi:hypothetical protein
LILASKRKLALSATKWAGTVAGVCGATDIALSLCIMGYGFVLFLLSSLLWTSWRSIDG